MDGCFIKGKISLRIGTNPVLESGDNLLRLNVFVRFHYFGGALIEKNVNFDNV